MADRMSLDVDYFDDIFASDDDPWSLGNSSYEATKFARSVAVLSDRRYATAIEVGCAQGVMTRQLAPLCDDLLAIDIAAAAVRLARERCRDLPQVRFAQVAFPRATPDDTTVELIVMSEIVYYWGDADIARVAVWVSDKLTTNGRLLLVHWTGETDYPQSGDAATTKLLAALGDTIVSEHAERSDCYRLDLWRRR